MPTNEKCKKLTNSMARFANYTMLANAVLFLIVLFLSESSGDMLFLVLGIGLYGAIFSVFFLLAKFLMRKERYGASALALVAPVLIAVCILGVLLLHLTEPFFVNWMLNKQQ